MYFIRLNAYTIENKIIIYGNLPNIIKRQFTYCNMVTLTTLSQYVFGTSEVAARMF